MARAFSNAKKLWLNLAVKVNQTQHMAEVYRALVVSASMHYINLQFFTSCYTTLLSHLSQQQLEGKSVTFLPRTIEIRHCFTK